MKPSEYAHLTEPQATTPPPAPLPMPAQDLRRAPEAAQRRLPPTPRVRLARLVAFGGGAALSAYGAVEMWGVVSDGGVIELEWAFLVLFTLTFGWIALSAATALAGLIAAPRPPQAAPAPDAIAGRTALVMPIYNEQADASFARLHVMAEDLLREAATGHPGLAGHAGPIEIFVLSDTRDPEIALQEAVLAERLRAQFSGRIPVWYRRRRFNHARKAGNIQDFIEHWGGRYAYLLVLDADSLMSGATILEMIRRMAAEPRLALLQTTPQLIGGVSLFARLQQFASALYGPIAARGVAAWQGLDGNFWGHNALIRTEAFAAHAGLPTLPGRAPFGGHVLSHDFVEAALLRRAGWDVRMDPDLQASWEESPPSALAACVRDRRWAQGNLQHSKVIGARGLAWPNRAHFAIGIASFLMSPIWLALLICGFALSLQAGLTEFEYFNEGFQLFPTWPSFDAERMLALLGVSVAVLLAPKALGLAAALLSRSRRRAHGGAARLLASAAIELVASTLLAPLFMAAHTRHILEIFQGRDSGWSAQARDADQIGWGDALRLYRVEMIVGGGAAAAVAYLSPTLLLWLSPVLLPLILAPALSRLSAAQGPANALRRRGLLLTGAESRAPALLADLRARRVGYRRLAEGIRLEDFLDQLKRRSCASPAEQARAIAAEPIDAEATVAAAKLARSRDGADALRLLTAAESSALLLSGARFGALR